MTTPLDKARQGLAVASEGLGLVERLAALLRPDPTRKAARLRARADRLEARGKVDKAARLRAQADRIDMRP